MFIFQPHPQPLSILERGFIILYNIITYKNSASPVSQRGSADNLLHS